MSVPARLEPHVRLRAVGPGEAGRAPHAGPGGSSTAPTRTSALALMSAARASSGQSLRTVFEPGKKYLTRLVNSAVEGALPVQHRRALVDRPSGTTLVPIVPYTTDSVLISMCQRYSVVVEAPNAAAGDCWLRGGGLRPGVFDEPQPGCHDWYHPVRKQQHRGSDIDELGHHHGYVWG